MKVYTNFLKSIILVILILFTGLHSFAQQPNEIEQLTAGREKRMEWWNNAKFGLFIHWGLFSELAGEYNNKKIKGLGEWIMYTAKIPVSEYRKIPAAFNPVKFNADDWVKVARDAGMKYLIITAKHCDGFAMFDSEVSSYNIVDATPFKRDPMKELEAACKKYGLRFGFYYSHDWDWNEPNALGLENTWDYPDKKSKNPDIYYNTKSIPQVKELVTKYDPAVIWFDVPTDITWEQSFKFLKTVREARPNCIINDRISKSRSEETSGDNQGMGDYVTPEQYIPASQTQPFEVCMTLNDTWGYKFYDHNWKNADIIVENLIDIAAKGGNYLLNIGPDANGIIPAQSVRILKLVGNWMKINGESIYGSTANPIGNLPSKNLRCTAKPGKLFIHLFEWPEGNEIIIPGINATVRSVYYLADPLKKSLSFKNTSNHDLIVDLEIEKSNPAFIDPYSTTLVIEYSGEIKHKEAEQLIDPSFRVFFDPMHATTSGKSFKYGFNNYWNENRGFETLNWRDTTSMAWNFRTIRDGKYEAVIEYAGDENCVNNEMKVTIGNETFSFTTENTGGWYKYKETILGKVILGQGTNSKVVIIPQIIKGSKVMNIKSLSLLPIIR